MKKQRYGLSSRHFKRLVHNKQIEFLKKSAIASNEQQIAVNNNGEAIVPDPVIVNECNFEQVDNNNGIAVGNQYANEARAPNFSNSLKQWVINHNINRSATESLLRLLKTQNVEVPLSRSGLMKSGFTKITTIPISKGQYWHYGLKTALQQQTLPEINCKILIDVFVDGCPLFKSSPTTIWPILGSIVGEKRTPPFLIGAFVGKSKPGGVVEFLEPFVNEMIQMQNGFDMRGRSYTIGIRAFICDSPARAFISGTVGHTASRGCSKCCQIAKKIGTRLALSETIGPERTDESFKNRFDTQHHLLYFQNNVHPLERLGINMVSQFPLDVMHLIDLGVTKKMLIAIVNSKHTKNKLTAEQHILLEKRIIMIRKHTPKEFQRKARSFNEIKLFSNTD